NPGNAPIRLVRAESDLADRIEQHMHEVDQNGVMRMRPLNNVMTPGRGATKFAPGGLHLMIYGLHPPDGVAPGQGFALPIRLCFDDGRCQTVVFDYRAVNGPAAEGTE